MKKYFNRWILFLGVSLVGVSCSKDFLDPEVDRYLTGDRKEELKSESPEAVALLIQGSLNGVYNDATKLVTPYTNHDTFGFKAFHLALDLTGQDMVQATHHHFGFDYNLDNNNAPYRRNTAMWRYFYRQVAATNIIIQDYFAETPTEEALKQKYAETRGVRGIAYYHLINLYQQTYKGNETALGVPLVLKTTDENLPRATVQEVYNQIIEDLTYSVDNNVVTESKKDVDKAVAAAYLAKTYAAMEDWVNVERYAQIAADSAPFTPQGDVEAGKWDIGMASWLWGFDITAETTGLYASFYSHIDNTIKGYPSLGVYKSIYSDLYNSIRATDVRKKIFKNSTLFPDIASKYSALPEYASLKYITAADFTGDYCFLRKEDPHLLLAEAYVEQNRLTDAQNALNDLVKTNRDASYDATVFTTQDDLRAEVRLQRRIELWGEGTSYFDLKRWKLGIDRTVPAGNNHRTQISLPAGDLKWVYKIPQTEIESNPNIIQNP